MKYIDLKFIRMMSLYLNKFTENNSDLFNFRCPFCGDSAKDENLARGYLFSADNTYIYKCHNCGISKNLNSFIKDVNHTLFTEYKKEKLLSKGYTPKHSDINKDVLSLSKTNYKIESNIGNKLLKKMVHAKDNKKAYDYLVNERKLPEDKLNNIYYIEDTSILFMSIPKYKIKLENNKKKPLKTDAIVIPFINDKGIVTHLQLRLFGGKLRYIILECVKSNRIFGTNNVDKNKTVYVFEGAFDAMFTNGIAVTNGNLHTKIDYLKKNYKDFVLVYDKDMINNEEIYNSIKKSISKNCKVVIYDPFIIKSDVKDINDMVKSNLIQDVTHYLKNNTYQGFKAVMYLDSVKQIDKHNSPFGVL